MAVIMYWARACLLLRAMHTIMVIVFWLVICLFIYSYALYPLLLAGLGRIVRRPVEIGAGPGELLFVSVVVAAHNEESVIAHKLANCRITEYPTDKLEFLFGSDGSQDRTVPLIRELGGANVHLTAFPQQRGKAAVLNDLILRARGTVVVFSDANSLFEPSAILHLVKHFQNPRVGGVCGRLMLYHPAGADHVRISANESLYWRYETLIKRLEGRLGILASANGAIYAVRRELFRPLPTDRPIADDFVVGAGVLAQGFWMTFEPEAVAREMIAADLRDDLRRKIRVGEISYNALPAIAPLLWPRRGLVALMLWSHKLIRWAGPFLLLLILAVSACLSREPIYGVALTAQVGVYLAAAVGFLLEPRGALPRWLTFPYYFVGANIALLLGLLRSLTRRGDATWTRVGR